jgi:thymidylate synthase (FAD)
MWRNFMKFIEPSYEILTEQNPFKKIESAGRTCYKSTAKEGDTAEAFVERLSKRKHYAMLEFATFLFEVTDGTLYQSATMEKYLNTSVSDGKMLVSGNLRALNECGVGQKLLAKLVQLKPEWSALLYANPKQTPTQPVLDTIIPIFEDVKTLSIPSRLKHEYLTVRVITCRGVTHEIVRNRPFSFAQESTRYICYGKDGEPMLFILPPWIEGKSRELMLSREFSYDCETGYLPTESLYYFLNSCVTSEFEYSSLLKLGWQPQQAREILPNAVKTEIVICGNLEQWKHFFYLRCDKPAHPQMREWTIPLYNQLRAENLRLWGDVGNKINLD